MGRLSEKDFAMRHFTFWVAAALVACSEGIEPPSATVTIALPGGSFVMGSTTRDPCDEGSGSHFPCDAATQSETIRNSVKLQPFCIDQHEVTVGQYRYCVETEDCEKPQITSAGEASIDASIASYYSKWEKYKDYPVLGVSWAAAAHYCELRGGRLPSEAEWEYAANSGSYEESNAPTFVWANNTVDAAKCGSEGGNLNDADVQNPPSLGVCTGNLVQPVMHSEIDKTRDNVYDLIGNAQEWVADAFDFWAYCDQEKTNFDLFFMDDAQPKLMPAAYHAGGCGFDCSEQYASLYSQGGCTSGNDMSDICVNCSQDHDACISFIEDAFDACLEACGQQDVAICSQINDWSDVATSNVSSFWVPWCEPRSDFDGHAIEKSEIKVPQKEWHVIRGGHFQTSRLCEARLNARHFGSSQSPLVGFRCAYDAGNEAGNCLKTH